ncbi:MAG: hypothetical protein ACTSX9_00595 [Candidatus Njordarchaeales archaeon]
MSEENKRKKSAQLIETLVNGFLKNDERILRETRVILWLNFFGPRASYRELRLYEIDENFSTFAIYGARLEITGLTFLKNTVAVEIERGHFVERELLDKQLWHTFLKRVLNNEKPKVLMSNDFREKFGLPLTLSEIDIYVLSVEL